MNEDLIPIALPPGLFRNGTRYQAKGRWWDANLIRFQGPRIQPVGGWVPVQAAAGGSVQSVSGIARGVHTWAANDGKVKLGIGTHTNAYMLFDGVLTDITPAIFTPGTADSAYASGGTYGGGSYTAGLYGTGSLVSALTDAGTWALDNFGDFLVGCLSSDGQILVWDGNLANKFVAAAGAPTSCQSLVVTPERFLVALGAGGDKRKVQWPDQETTTVWTPADTNKAGSFIIPTNGRIRCGARTSRETLIWTDADVWAMNFIGGVLVHSFRQAGEECGIIGPKAFITVNTEAYWMGNGSFFYYNGMVNSIPCEVQDYVFSDMNKTQAAKFWGMSFASFGEVWWFYCSAGSTEIDRYVSYNHREQHWNTGRLVRVSGVDSGASPNPILLELARAAQGTLTSTGVNVANNDTVTIGAKTYTFQTALTNVDGNIKIAASAALTLTNLKNAINLTGVAGTDYATLMTLHPTAQAETLTATTLLVRARVSGTGGNALVSTETSAQLSWGAAVLQNGGNVLGFAVSDVWEHEVADDRGTEVPYVESGPYELDEGNRVMAIYRIVPDEKTSGDVQATIYGSMGPNPEAAETAYGPYSMTNPTDVRLTLRIARIRFTQVVETAWRIGTMRFGMKPKGRR